MSKNINTVGVLSDLHCGSKWGLLPPSYWNEHTGEAVKWMWKCWKWLAGNWPDLDLLILNGDMIDGRQYRSQHTGLVTNSMGEQTRIAIECLAPMAAKATKIIRTEGTAYHEGFDGPLGELDEHFGIRDPGGQERIVRDIRLGGDAILNVKHQPEGSGGLYRGTFLDREVLWAAVTEHLKHLPIATHIVRSHLHSDGHLRGFGKEINYTPGWQLQAPYATQRKRYRWMPDIGGLLMVADPLGFKGYRTMTKIFPLPTVEAANYGDL